MRRARRTIPTWRDKAWGYRAGGEDRIPARRVSVRNDAAALLAVSNDNPPPAAPRPSPRPVTFFKMDNERFDWTPERVETLRRLWAEGESSVRIAKALGKVTKSAVIGKLTRLGLTGKGIRRGNPAP